ncbi:MAG: hypothetical protein CL678_15775 [Bdellovibrionaceae bacterium]|nr:hypothetical protein [Pseudobdellovibrionaceae bacterium]
MNNKVDLKASIGDVLLKVSQASHQRWLALFPEPIDHLPVKQQMEVVNGFWRVQLGLLNEPTYRVRENLAIDINSQQWMQRFEQDIVPFIVRHNLPRRIL